VVSGASSVACGYVSTCAIVNGVVECLGDNTYGEIGQGTTISSYGSATPVSSLNAMKQVAIGFGHACAVRNDGAAFCWGYNAYGQLGIGSFANQSTPVAVSSLSNIQQMALSLYATCARRGDGTVWCWGYDADGEVGDGTGNKTGITLPVQVQGLPPSASIVAGQQDICSIGTDSTINCWGGNAGSQLGNNTTNSAWVPAPLTL
jgi:alpha-tubulin suppressor-like RCC1 family protein